MKRDTFQKRARSDRRVLTIDTKKNTSIHKAKVGVCIPRNARDPSSGIAQKSTPTNNCMYTTTG